MQQLIFVVDKIKILIKSLVFFVVSTTSSFSQGVTLGGTEAHVLPALSLELEKQPAVSTQVELQTGRASFNFPATIKSQSSMKGSPTLYSERIKLDDQRQVEVEIFSAAKPAEGQILRYDMFKWAVDKIAAGTLDYQTYKIVTAGGCDSITPFETTYSKGFFFEQPNFSYAKVWSKDESKMAEIQFYSDNRDRSTEENWEREVIRSWKWLDSDKQPKETDFNSGDIMRRSVTP